MNGLEVVRKARAARWGREVSAELISFLLGCGGCSPLKTSEQGSVASEL